MRLNQVTANGGTSTGRTVVRALRTRISTCGPAKRPFGLGIEHGVLLLDTKPGFLVFGSIHGFIASKAGVGGNGLDLGHSAIGEETRGFVGIAEHQDVVSATERIAVDGLRNEVDLRVFTGSLLRVAGRKKKLRGKWVFDDEI